jgi:hypothetical protein
MSLELVAILVTGLIQTFAILAVGWWMHRDMYLLGRISSKEYRQLEELVQRLLTEKETGPWPPGT